MPDALKEMYNTVSVEALAAAIQAKAAEFDQSRFLEMVFDEAWADRALKQRMRHITACVGALLPQSYRPALEILIQVIPSLPELGFHKMVFPDFVELYGQGDYEASIPALELFTQYISAEFAIRPFIVRYPVKSMAQMLAWSEHEHEGVRRLASEGCRPRLPWGMGLPALKADPSPILPILEKLKEDPSETVRRSVANNLNDISKDNPDVVIETLSRWQVGASAQMTRLISHALRTLLKAGRPEALALLGYSAVTELEIRELKVVPEQIPMGGEVTISFEVVSLAGEPLNLMIDYVLHLVRARGKRSAKVFKLKKVMLAEGGSLSVVKKHSFRPISTRRYYPGEHSIQPQVNGVRMGEVRFMVGELEESSG